MVFIAIAGFSAIARSVMIFALSMHSHQDTKQGSFSAIARSVMIFAEEVKG